MEKQFTGGLWECDVELNDAGDNAAVFIDNGPNICMICSHGREWSSDSRKRHPEKRWFNKEDIANAKIITAAPDLLGALIRIIETIDAGVSIETIKRCEEKYPKTSDMSYARAAIAKALGK